MHDPEHSSPPPGCVAAVLPAAGSGERFGSEQNKLFALLAGQPLWFHAASRLAARPEVGRLIMAIAESDRSRFEGDQKPLVDRLSIELVPGGAERTDSVRSGLEAVGSDSTIQLIAIHDAARPLVSDHDLQQVFSTAFRTRAAILASPVAATLKRDLGLGMSCETVDRRGLFIALTPQVFDVGLLKQAYEKHNGRAATDDAQLVERIGQDVSLVHGSADNLKITYPEDLLVAEAILARQSHHA